MNGKKIENIQALRGVAALAVLIAHLGGTEKAYGGPTHIFPEWLQLGVTGVDLFFVISGFVMIHVTASLPQGFSTTKTFLFKRVARIYPLYWVITIALLLLYMGKKWLFGEDTLITSPVASIFLLPHEGVLILNVGWTLVYEMYFYFVFAFMLLMTSRSRPTLLLIWASIITLFSVTGLSDFNAWTKVIFGPLALEFIAGCAIALFIHHGANRFAFASLATGSLILLIQAIGFFDHLYPEKIVDFGWRTLLFGTPCALVVYGAVAMEKSANKKAPKWLIATGDASYAIYLVHMPIFMVVGKIFSLFGSTSAFSNALLILFLGTASLLAGFAAHWWIEKPLLTQTSKLGQKLFKSS